MFKKLLGTFVVAISLMFSTALFADSSMCKHGLKHMLESLQLSDEQKAKIKPIIEQMKSTMKATGSQMDALKSKIHEQIHAASMDKDTVNSLIDQKTALIGSMMKTKVATVHQVLSVLTEEQKTKLHNMMKDAEEKMAQKYKSCHDND
ncbi:16 kD immunogenic protein [Legionella geestiana]|uniref:16 kD immunogenic protein n=1 Tax=Legionella geestiana TaxID=45065 RepID=A0A0W0U460_9GAMM|nr:Spy/CpxP family protein refolding chaperone [Legionella geestiana]KTD02379.1 16 kD immunogenic protein [Legionella geestiana]QBS12147.1 periplasmic heavy metal sensor [Legionella geestiana]STX53125.1 16 kD immunogenic protein [Legionella geestiana]